MGRRFMHFLTPARELVQGKEQVTYELIQGAFHIPPEVVKLLLQQMAVEGWVAQLPSRKWISLINGDGSLRSAPEQVFKEKSRPRKKSKRETPRSEEEIDSSPLPANGARIQKLTELATVIGGPTGDLLMSAIADLKRFEEFQILFTNMTV